MKKILIPILWIGLYLNPIHAQIQKGSWLVGGSGTLYQSRFLDRAMQFNSSFRSEILYLSPELGYFVTNRWLVGMRLGISLSKTSFTTLAGQVQQQINYESYSFEPFTRIYFNPQHRFKCFYELYGGRFTNKNRTFISFLDTMRPQSGLALGNSIGVNYFLTDNIAIEGSINYYFYNKRQYSNRMEETVLPKLGFNPAFRMRLFLNTKSATIESVQKYFGKGNLTYGLRMNLVLNRMDEFTASTFTPSIGYFLMDNLMIGSEFSMNYAPNSNFGVHLMPEVRYYQPISRLTQWFGRMLFLSTYSSSKLGSFTSKFRTQEVEMGIGLNRFLAPNISVQGSGNIAISTDNLNSSIEFRPNLRIGFQYFMNKK
jgi:hypothetical protein